MTLFYLSNTQFDNYPYLRTEASLSKFLASDASVVVAGAVSTIFAEDQVVRALDLAAVYVHAVGTVVILTIFTVTVGLVNRLALIGTIV